MKLPNFNRLNQLKNKTVSFFVEHKMLILASIIVTIFVVCLGTWVMKVRNDLIINMKSFQNDSSDGVNYSSVPASSSSSLDDLLSSGSSVLGVSSDDSPSYVAPTPYPVMTLVPIPSIVIPTSVPSTSSSSSCSGKPNADNSQAYVSSKTSLVNNAVTITVDLLDCNNNHVGDDDLKITLSNDDSSARVNGSSLPVTIKAQSGKASFSVNSQNVVTDTFIITDTNNSFTVTTPGYHNPSVTFSNNSSGNTNCSTAAGVPNSWYSDVYISSVTGTSARFTVDIRDCSKNAVSSDTLSISLSSGDSSAQVDGNNLPYSINVQNGEVGFTVTTQNAATDTFVIQDTTSSFTVTDTNNQNPSITFSGPTAPAPTVTPTPVSPTAPTTAPSEAPTSGPTNVPTPIPIISS